MNTKFALVTVGVFCFAVAPAFGDETNLLARWGAPTNNLVAAADPIRQSVDSEDLAEALGVKHWDFLVQVPYAGTLPISFHWIENGKDRLLGQTGLVVDRMDPMTGKEIPPPYQDRILFVIFPVDTSTDDQWSNSAKLRIFIKDYDRHDSTVLLIENPFKNNKRGYSIPSAPMAVHKDNEKIEPGSVKRAMGTEFDVMRTADNQRTKQSSFRISFN